MCSGVHVGGDTVTASHETPDPQRDLILERQVDLPVELVWQAWTEPAELKAWFTPRPWQTVECEIDLRPGGIFRTVMRSPDGNLVDAGAGCYLVVDAPHRLVWTSTLEPGFRPVDANDWTFTADLTFTRQGSGTKYLARVLHASAEAAEAHAQMGFADGWGTALDQLVEHMTRDSR